MATQHRSSTPARQEINPASGALVGSLRDWSGSRVFITCSRSGWVPSTWHTGSRITRTWGRAFWRFLKNCMARLAAACGCLAPLCSFLVRPGHRTLVIPFATTAGALVLASLGPLYSPLQFLRWASVYRPIPELTPVVSEGILVVAISTIATATNALVVLSRRPRRTVSSSHGSARWGSGEPLGEPEGLLIGRGLHDRELFRFNGEGHLRSWPGVATRLQVCTRPTSTMWTGSAPPSRPRAKQNSGCGRRWRSSASRRSTAREDADATART